MVVFHNSFRRAPLFGSRVIERFVAFLVDAMDGP